MITLTQAPKHQPLLGKPPLIDALARRRERHSAFSVSGLSRASFFDGNKEHMNYGYLHRTKNTAKRFVLASAVWCVVAFGATQARADNCANDPCVNGTCIDNGTTFQCECNAGWEGPYCDIDTDDCTPNPCLNGQCSDVGADAYVCDCEPGWQGVNCGVDVDDCEGNPCGGGLCSDTGLNSFECSSK